MSNNGISFIVKFGSFSSIGVKHGVSRHFGEHKRLVYIFSILLIVGLVVGIVTIASMSKSFSHVQVIDLFLVNGFKVRATVFSYFFRSLLDWFIYCLIVFVLCMWLLPSYVSYVVVFFKGYQLGLNITAMCIIYGFGGILGVIFIYLPLNLLLGFVFVNFVSICKKRASCRRFNKRRGEDLGFLILFLIIFFALCLLEAILVPSMLKRIVITV